MKTRLVLVPGIGGSGPAHWQSRWEDGDEQFVRFSPGSWDEPDLDDWCTALSAAVGDGEVPVLVAHSLGCLLVAHWAERSHLGIAGAFLVSVPDPAAAAFPGLARGFRSPPLGRLRFPSLVVSSSNDPFGDLEYQKRTATLWNSAHVEVGPLGHINASSGIDDWPQGRALLESFVEGLELRNV